MLASALEVPRLKTGCVPKLRVELVESRIELAVVTVALLLRFAREALADVKLAPLRCARFWPTATWPPFAVSKLTVGLIDWPVERSSKFPGVFKLPLILKPPVCDAPVARLRVVHCPR